MFEINITIKGAVALAVPIAAIALATIAKDVIIRYLKCQKPGPAGSPQTIISDYRP